MGFIFLLIGVVLLWNNEGRAIKRETGLKEGLKLVKSIDASAPSGSLNGDLIHTSGLLTTTSNIYDDVLNLRRSALRLKREVEMYQWVEHKSKESDKKLGGAEEVTTTFTYSKEWKTDLHKSSNFEVPTGHENPGTFPLDNQILNTAQANLGTWKIPSNFIDKLNDFEGFSFNQQQTILGQVNKNYRSGGEAMEAYIGNGSPGNPQVGDLRIRCYEILPETYSIVGKATNGSIDKFQTSNGTNIAMIRKGNQSYQKMFEDAISGNTVLTWMLRLAGILLLFIGFRLICKPLVVVADVVPFIGRILNSGVSLTAFILALILAIPVISLAWLWYRPLLSIGLLILAGAIWIYVNRSFVRQKIQGNSLAEESS